MSRSNKGSILYLPHGGGPLPLLGDPGHADLAKFLRTVRDDLVQPDAVLVVSAHWEKANPTIQSAQHPDMLYDYSGFPPESYKITYPAPGHPKLANLVRDQLQKVGFKPVLDAERGFDHGVFVPLKLIIPDAEIPCFQISLIKGLNPAQHIELGRALSFLRDENVLIIGSGMSFHNMRAFFQRSESAIQHDEVFDQWLSKTCCSDVLTSTERDHELINWEQAPSARDCHPREEHLLPLHVCYGAAGPDGPPAERVFSGQVLGKRVSALMWR